VAEDAGAEDVRAEDVRAEDVGAEDAGAEEVLDVLDTTLERTDVEALPLELRYQLAATSPRHSPTVTAL